MIFRKHDRYVFRAFLSSLGAVLFFFSVIIVVLDSAERVRRLTRYWDRIVEGGRHPLMVLGEYYATLLPFLWVRLMPFGTPEQVIEKLEFIHQKIGARGVMTHFAYGGMPYDEANRNMRLFVDKVLPEVQRIGDQRGPLLAAA